MQRVITSQLLPAQQPNHFAEAEKMHDELDVQDTGKSGELVSIERLIGVVLEMKRGPKCRRPILRSNVSRGLTYLSHHRDIHTLQGSRVFVVGTSLAARVRCLWVWVRSR
jgi:hypothetical protein